MIVYDFDRIIDRRRSDSAKWNWYPPDVLPLWVADMDFPAPDEVAHAIKARVDHNLYGYQIDAPELRALLVERLAARHALVIPPEQIVFTPGLVGALNLICRALLPEDAGVLIQPPIYPPFFTAPTNGGRTTVPVPLTPIIDGVHVRYEIDFDALRAAITPDVKAFMLCNPHNPTGHVYTRAELEQIAALVVEHDLLLISDEIHCDLVFTPHQHVSIASLNPDIAARTITLLAPSKTFNLAGLACSFMVAPTAEIRDKLFGAVFNNGLLINNLGFTAAEAAYRHGQSWLDQALAYMRENRDLIAAYVEGNFPRARFTTAEGTYLAWIDFSDYALEGGAYHFFLEQAKVAFSDGATFGGDAYKDCVRVNFACPRKTLWEALRRMSFAFTPSDSNA